MKEYKNELGNIISKELAESLNHYEILHYDSSNLIIKTETYYDGDINDVKLYNNQSLNHEDILNGYINSNFNLMIVDFEVVFLTCRLQRGVLYKTTDQNQILGRLNELYDASGNLMGSERFFDESDDKDFHSSIKLYWDSNLNPKKELFEAKFNKTTGEVLYLFFNQEHIHDQDAFSLGIEDLDQLIEITGMSEELAQYYTYHQVIPQDINPVRSNPASPR